MMSGNLSTQWQVLEMSSHAMTSGSSFTQQQVQWAPYSWPVMSSMVGPMEVVFRSIEVTPPSIGRAGWHGGKMATFQQLRSEFLLLPTLSPPGPIVSRLIEEAMTSTN